MQKMARRKRSALRPALWAVTALLAAGTAVWYALDGGAAPMAMTAPDRAALAERAGGLDLNAASEEQLQELPGVGPVLAERIVAWRQANGPFTGPEDVMAVQGIGPATYEAIAPYIEF